MLCKRMAPTLLALLLPLALTALVSCGGNDTVPEPPAPPPAPPSSEAGISGLSISLGELFPEFSPAINNYSTTVGHLGEDSIGVTVTLKDPKARLTVNGLVVASGSRTDVALRDTVNTIRIAVTAEDGKTPNSATLTVNRLMLNTAVCVLDGISGALVGSAKLTLSDSGGRVLAEGVPLPKEKNGGAPIFALAPGQKYNIYAKGDGTATACFANFDPVKEEMAVMYCLRTSTTFYSTETPVIEDISFATTNAYNAAWKTMPNGDYYVGRAADVAAVRVTAITKNPISVGFGDAEAAYVPIAINVDEVASINTGNPATAAATGTSIETNVPVTRGGANYYRTTYRFDMPSSLLTSVFNREHYLSVVVYDVPGNRTEQRVYMTITDSTNNVPTDADLSGVTPTVFYAQSNVFMGGGDLADRSGDQVNAIDLVDPYSAYHTLLLRFYVRMDGSAGNLGIRGFEVWRANGSDSASSFVKIATVSYATLSTSTSAGDDFFHFYDRSPTLAEGDVYYRVRAFNGNPTGDGHSKFSAPFKGLVLPPTTTGPAASHKAAQDKLWPEFRIAPSNPKMFAKAADGTYPCTDRFYFTLFIRTATSPYPFLMVPFRVNFSESGTTGNRYGFPEGKPTAEYMQVTTYNGTTSTISAGTWNYASDSRTEDGQTVYTPFAYLDDDGSVVINTDSATFRTAMQNAVRSAYAAFVDPPFFRIGVAYLWNLFGAQGGIFWNNTGIPARWADASSNNAAYFGKGYNAAPYASAWLGVSVGSHQLWGLGAPEGWFALTITPDAE